MSEELTFPVAETFYSIQGEGPHTGTPMWFLRLAGCNVGKYEKDPRGTHQELDDPREGIVSPFQILHPEYATCTSFSGETFICDTDYRVKERLTLNQIGDRCVAETEGAMDVGGWISITGGEPFILKELDIIVRDLIGRGYQVLIETSGTLPIKLDAEDSDAWQISCSPKAGFLPKNREYISYYKMLVRDAASEKAVEAFVKKWQIHEEQVWIQPVDEAILPPTIHNINLAAHNKTKAQVDFSISCVKRHPGWRLSLQVHKWLGVR